MCLAACLQYLRAAKQKVQDLLFRLLIFIEEEGNLGPLKINREKKRKTGPYSPVSICVTLQLPE